MAAGSGATAKLGWEKASETAGDCPAEPRGGETVRKKENDYSDARRDESVSGTGRGGRDGGLA